MDYEVAKFIHVVGIIILIGNVTASALWKFFADRTGDPMIISFAQRLITITDWSLTFWGVVLTMAGGYGAAAIGHINIFSDKWLVLGQILFLLSGLIWLGLLVPLQIRMARAAREFRTGGIIPDAYRGASRAWFFFGVIATIPLVVAAWVMISKPL